MRLGPRTGDSLSAKAILLALLTCLVCAAQQEPAAAAAEAAKTAAPNAAGEEPASTAAAAATALPQSGIVTANILVVRARPAPHYERVGQFARGDTVTIVGGNADWYEVRVPADTRAWIAAQYLDGAGAVTADQVRLHSGPGLVFTTFCTVQQGTTLDVLGPPVDGWQQVRAPADACAWVSRAYVRALVPEPPAAAAETGVAAAAEPKAETPQEPTPESPAAPVAATPAEAVGAAPPAAPPAAVAATPEVVAETVPPAPAVTVPAATAPEPAAAVAETLTPPAPAEAATPAAVPAAETVAAPPPVAEGTAPAATEETPPPVLPPVVPPPAAETVIVPTAPALDAPVVMKEGVLLSLKGQATELATHVLCMRVGTTAYPICYLKSARLDLTEWENRDVRVYGRELHVPGWSLLVLHVHSIQVNLKR